MPANVARELFLHQSIRDLYRQFVEMMSRIGVWRGNSKLARAVNNGQSWQVVLRANFQRLLWGGFHILPDFRINPDLHVDDAVVREWQEGGHSEEDCRAMVLDIRHAWKTMVDRAESMMDNPLLQIYVYQMSSWACFQVTGHARAPTVKVLSTWIKDRGLSRVDHARGLYCLLLRYEWLGRESAGYQMGCPVRRELQTLGCTFEAFASPLNVHLGNMFCSVSADTDVTFGSCGDWFAMDPSLWPAMQELNPPFVESIIDRMVDRLADGFQSRGPSTPTFCMVIVPNWSNCRGIDRMSSWVEASAPFHARKWVLEAGQHSYVPGNVHQTKHRLQTANVTTLVFGLSTREDWLAWLDPIVETWKATI